MNGTFEGGYGSKKNARNGWKGLQNNLIKSLGRKDNTIFTVR